MKIKQCCQKCYYGGTFIPNESLASCNSVPKEPTITKYDELFRRQRQFVKRRNWDDECECGNFIPNLSEIDGDFELEAICTFDAHFYCPFCNEPIDVYDLAVEEIRLITCDECAKEIAVHGKAI